MKDSCNFFSAHGLARIHTTADGSQIENITLLIQFKSCSLLTDKFKNNRLKVFCILCLLRGKSIKLQLRRVV